MKINSIQTNQSFCEKNAPVTVLPLQMGVARYKGDNMQQSHEPTKSLPSYEFFRCYNLPKSLAREKVNHLNIDKSATFSLSERIFPFSREDLERYSGAAFDVAAVYNRCSGDFDKIDTMFKIHKMMKENILVNVNYIV